MCLSSGLSKCLLVIFNIVFFILGLGLIILAAILLSDIKDSAIYDYLGKLPLDSSIIEEGIYRTSWLTNFAWALLVAGIVFFLVGGAGLFGALCQVEFLLTVYATVLFLIIALEIAIGVLAVKYTTKVQTFLLTFLTESITKYYVGLSYTDGTIALSGDSTGISDAWDYANVQFQCCGANNYTDFPGAVKWPGYYTVSGVNISASVPASCCKMVDTTKWPNSMEQISFVNITECLNSPDSTTCNMNGCYVTIYNKLKDYGLGVAIVAIIVGVVELLGLWAACSLRRSLNKDKVDPA